MSRNTLAIARGAGVIGATVALMVGATFAALTSTATLTANTFASATADLFVAGNNNPAVANTDTGFTITNIVPGGPASTPFLFNLKNNGGVDLDVTVFASASTVTGTLDNTKVHFCFTRTSGPSTQCFTYAEMLALFNTLPGGPVTVGSGNVQYSVTVSMDADAVTGGGASVAPFTLTFTGTQTP